MDKKDNNQNELTERENEVFRLLLVAKPNKTIASALGISQKTVEEHLTSIYAKIGVNSRAEAILWGIEHLRDFPH